MGKTLLMDWVTPLGTNAQLYRAKMQTPSQNVSSNRALCLRPALEHSGLNIFGDHRGSAGRDFYFIYFR